MKGRMCDEIQIFQVAIDKAEKTCLKKIQSHWKRYLQQRKFVAIVRQKRAAEADLLKAARVQSTREEQENPGKSSSVSAGLVSVDHLESPWKPARGLDFDRRRR